jgi:ATP-dependent helicase HrpA
MRYVVADEKGQTLASSRDITGLHKQFFGRMQSEEFDKARTIWEREDISGWDFGDLPESIALGNPACPAGVAFPALEVSEGKTNLRLYASLSDAENSHRYGVASLYEKHFESELKYLKKTLSPAGNLKLWSELFGGTKNVARIIYNKVLHDLFFISIRNKELFYEHAINVRAKIIPHGQEMLRLAAPVLEANYQTSQTLNRLEKQHQFLGPALSYLRQLRQELSCLLPADFLIVYPQERVSQLGRYVCALEIRAGRGIFHLENALEKTREIQGYTSIWQGLKDDIQPVCSAEKAAAIEELFWMIEEYKVSLFAQELKTPFPVSRKRLDKFIDNIRALV